MNDVPKTTYELFVYIMKKFDEDYTGPISFSVMYDRNMTHVNKSLYDDMEEEGYIEILSGKRLDWSTTSFSDRHSFKFKLTEKGIDICHLMAL